MSGASDPRLRAQARLRWLRAANATAAGAGMLACSGIFEPDDPGYGVVDPMPTPTRRCEDSAPQQVARDVVATAEISGAPEARVLRVRLGMGWQIDDRASLSGQPEISGGKAQSPAAVLPRSLEVTIEAAPDAQEVALAVPLACAGPPQPVRWRFPVRGPEADAALAAGGSVAGALIDAPAPR